MFEVALHQRHGALFIARGQGGHDGSVFFVRMFGGAGGLVHQRDEGTAGDQIAQHLRQHLVAHELGHAHVEVAQQLGAAAGVGAAHGGFLGGHVGAQGLDLGGCHLAHEGAGHLGLEHAAHGKHLAGFLG